MKGQIAKDKVVSTIAEAFGDKWIGEVDKKYYVWSTENGTPMQVCLALTIPKTPVGAANATPPVGQDNKINFEDVPTIEPAQISAQEQKIAEDLLARLGL